MRNASIVIENLQRLQSVNPDGQYCITANASGYYRVVDINEGIHKHVDIGLLLSNLTVDPETDFLVDY